MYVRRSGFYMLSILWHMHFYYYTSLSKFYEVFLVCSDINRNKISKMHASIGKTGWLSVDLLLQYLDRWSCISATEVCCKLFVLYCNTRSKSKIFCRDLLQGGFLCYELNDLYYLLPVPARLALVGLCWSRKSIISPVDCICVLLCRSH